MAATLRARARDAAQLSRWYAGLTDQHPHGLSHRRWVIPYGLSSRVSNADSDLYGGFDG